MWQTLSGRLATHCGGWTGCEAGCQHQPSCSGLRIATIMHMKQVERNDHSYLKRYTNINHRWTLKELKNECKERAKEGLRGTCNVRWACDPSFHRFRQGGLDLITFSFPPAITFPVDHFSPQCVCAWVKVCRERKKEWKEEVYVSKARVFVVDALLWKLWATSSVIWFQWNCP